MTTARLERSLRDLSRVPATGMVDACKAVERSAREVASSVGPVHLGKRKRSVRLRALSRIKARGTSHAEANVWGVPTGPWVWVTSGTSGHTIPKQRGGRNRKIRYVKGDRYDHPYGKPVHHPGSGGKGAWRRVVQRARRDVPKAYVQAVRKAVR